VAGSAQWRVVAQYGYDWQQQQRRRAMIIAPSWRRRRRRRQEAVSGVTAS